MEAPPVIEVRHLTVRYGGRVILDDVQLEVRQGEIMVIMGGSGSGKTTLLRHILGLERPAEGEIRVLGEDIAHLGSRRLHDLRRHMGVAFQGGALFGSLSVGENVALPLKEHAHLDAKTIDIVVRMKLEVVNLRGAEHLMPAQLSGGMVKRAALARAIVTDPRLLFFDEPSAGLDPVVSAELDGLIRELREAMHMTLIVVTHELESAFAIADRITILDRGRILMVGTVDEVRESPSERVQDLLRRRPHRLATDPDDYLRHLTEGD